MDFAQQSTQFGATNQSVPYFASQMPYQQPSAVILKPTDSIFQVIALLLDAGANTNALDDSGKSPLPSRTRYLLDIF